MHAITYALLRAIQADNRHQRQTEAPHTLSGKPNEAGLQPLAIRPQIHQAYAGAEPTDLHISLTRGDETLALFLELLDGGLTPPASMVTEGVEVILSPGMIQLFAATDKGDATWMGMLSVEDKRHFDGSREKRARWSEQVG